METLSLIFRYFSEIQRIYGDSLESYSAIASIYTSLIKAFDCDKFMPSSEEILSSLKESNPSEYAKITKDFKIFDVPKESEFKISRIENAQGFDLKSVLDFSIYEKDLLKKKNSIESNLNYKNSDFDKTFENLSKSELSKNPCLDFFKSEESRKELLEEIEILKKENFSADEKFTDFLNRCKGKNEISFEEKIQNFTQEEIQKLKDDCFVTEEEKGLDFDPIQKEDFENLQSLNETKEENSPQDLNETNEQFSIDPSNIENLLNLMGKDKPCITEQNRIIEEIKVLSKEYTDHVLTKIKVEKEYFYSRIFWASYDSISEVYGVPLSIAPGIDLTDDFISLNFQDFSKEIKHIKNEKLSKNGFNFFNFEINEKSKKEGTYFDVYKKYEKIIKSEKYTNGSATKEELENLDKSIQNDLIKELDRIENFVRLEAKLDYSRLYLGTLSKNLGFVPTALAKFELNRKNFNSNLKILEDRYKKAEKNYFDFFKKSENYLKSIDNKIEELNKVLVENDCFPKNPKTVTQEELEIKDFDLNETGDFRGLPDPSKPTIRDSDYWVKFAKMATTVGLFPIPQFSVSNKFSVDIRNFSDPEVKFPKGGPVIDDDGIPRFMFWPIGFVIPTPFSLDGIYRIPIPMVWKFINVTTIESPLRLLLNELIKIQSQLSGFREMNSIFTDDLDENRLWRSLPKGIIENVLSIFGIDTLSPIRESKREISNLMIEFKNGLDLKVKETIDEVDNESSENVNSLNNTTERFGRKLDSNIELWRAHAQSFLDERLSSLEVSINEKLNSIDLGDLNRQLSLYKAGVSNSISSVEDIIKSVDSCLNLNFNLDFGINPILNDIQKYGSSALNFAAGLKFPKFKIPFLRLSDYLTFSISNITDSLLNELREFGDSNLIFRYLSDLMNQIEDAVMAYFYNVLKFKLWEIKFPIRDLFKIQIPNTLINSLSLILNDFPSLTAVTFIGFSGIIPYPFVLLINESDSDIKGIIKARTLEFLITLDFSDPVKVIKRNYGSYTLPLKTQVDTFLNQSLGLYYEPKSKNYISLCDTFDRLGISLDEILGELINLKNLDFKLPDIWNSFEIPSADLLCKLSSVKTKKEALNVLISETKINPSMVPSSIGKVSTLRKFGISSFDDADDLIIDEFKSSFDASSFPSVKETLALNNSVSNELVLDSIGIAKKVKIDLLPQLTLKSPYLQDDLPTWERLQWWNIPFILFLIEFNIAAKFGAKFPIPEISPLAEFK